jgi:transposase
MSRFHSSAHLISWACISPRSDESAGKRRSTRIRKEHSRAVRLGGDTNERLLPPGSFLTHPRAAWPEEGDLGRRGIDYRIYHMLNDGTLYEDLGPNHPNARNKERQKNRLIKRLAELGYVVELAPQAS